MKDFKDKVAVITGAPSGIGKGLAERAAREGMKVVLAGINEANLLKVEQDLKAKGATAISVQTDVSKESDVEALARKTLDAFGSVDLLCNNAGVGGGTTIWESALEDWQWIIGVNLWGVIYGIRIFVPIMLSQDCECYIVNTASATGLRAPPGMGIYSVTKYGVVALSETLYQELGQRNAKIKVSVLCPSWVRTRVMDAERNRPAEHQVDNPAKRLSPQEIEAVWKEIANANTVLTPDQVADRTFEAIWSEQFYILTHSDSIPWFRTRAEDILNGRNPEVLR